MEINPHQLTKSYFCHIFVASSNDLAVFTTGAPSSMSKRDGSCPKENLNITGGSFVLSNSYSHGSLLRYMCPNGYYPSVQSRLCLDGHWTSKTKIRKNPECKSKKEGIILCHYIMNNWWTFFYTLLQYVFIHAFILEITCPNPRVFENGEVNPYKAKYVNDTTTYSCHSDYTFRGSAVRVCKPNGKWSGRTPICGRDCE